MKILTILFFAIQLIQSYQQDFTGVLGVDVPNIITDPQFYKCLVGRINFEHNSYIVLPYSSQNNFMMAVILAKQAGFASIHLLIDPMEFKVVDPAIVAQNIQQSLALYGVGVQGIWLKVFDNSPAWQISQNANVNIILNLFSALYDAVPNANTFGFYTTSTDYYAVTNGAASLAQGNNYWSAYGDVLPPGNSCLPGANNNIYGYKKCLVQQIRVGNVGCGYEYNIDILFPF
jgi:hypothetical protein